MSQRVVSDLVPGRIVQRAGYVTQLQQLINAPPGQLEQRLGYGAGRLRHGWTLLVLEEEVAAGDFVWAGSTEASAGFDPNELVEFGDSLYRVHVGDIRRNAFFDQAGDGERGDRMFDAFLALQLRLLNDRRSPLRIAKVVPAEEFGKPPSSDYPDAAPGTGVRQWQLRKPKRFLVAARVPAGHAYLGGGALR